MTRIRNVAVGVYRDEHQSAVKFAVKLQDGRTLMLSIPFNMDIPDDLAKDMSRPIAEEWMANIFRHEHTTKRFHCCGGMTHYGPKGHRAECPAFTTGGPVAIFGTVD